jgi:hypothetical protein
MKILQSAVILAVLCIPAIGHAQNAAPAGGLMSACASDLQSLCPNAASVADKRKCLMENSSKTSNNCQVAITAASNDASAFRAACAADFAQYCKGIPPGPQHRQCVAQNMNSFSAACQQELSKHPGLAKP